MPTRRAWLLAAMCTPPLARAHDAPPPELRAEWPAAAPRVQGRGQLRFLGLAIYEITLWAPMPLDPGRLGEEPLALAIDYQRALDGERIAERALTEMRRGGPLAEAEAARWLAEMKRLFPTVGRGDRLTGVLLPGQGARFHLNGRLRGALQDPGFAPRFFGIWLAAWTSEPVLRGQLLGTLP